MQVTEKKYTVKDYEMLEEGAPFQLINNDLVMSPSPTAEHQIISARLYNTLLYYTTARNNKGLLMYAPMDVYLDEGNVFQPDLLFIAEERVAELMKHRIHGAPDLVIEILSPSNGHYDLRQKKKVYEKYGVKEYIIVDPAESEAELYTLKDGKLDLVQKASKAEQLNSVLLPELVFELDKIFLK